MIYITVNSRNIKRVLIVIAALVIFGMLFCMWALSSRPESEESEMIVSDAQTTEQPLFSIVSLSDVQISAVSRSQELPDSVPAYVNLSVFSLSQPVTLPLESAFVSSAFGFRDHPINGKYSFHGGLDLAAAEGSPIRAMLGGVVSKAEYEQSYGNFVVIDHEDGLQTLYAHCLSLNVNVGDAVCAGDKIAEVGATGSATGPHLHVEFRYNGQRYDPAYILGGSYT